MILVFGSINIDLVARVETIPRPGETVLSAGYERLFGGKGANQAVAAARAGKPGASVVALVARVGDDEFGRAALANLEANGVNTDRVQQGAEPTGFAFIAVERGGENAITVAAGANAMLSAEAIGGGFSLSDLLVLQMEVPFPEALAAARRARADRARVIWNFAPAPATFAPSDLADLLAVTDVFVVNEHEAVSAAGILGQTAAPDVAAAAIAETGGTAVVLTAGARGAFAFMPYGARHRAEALSVEVVDTTGAGDTFVGVLAAGLAEGMSLPSALRRASLAGSLACRSVGAQAGMPDRATLDRLSEPPTL